MFDPSEFLKQAKLWVEDKNQANFRSAVSRAYYSLYHETLEFLKINHRSQLIKGIKYELNFGSGSPRYIDKSMLNALDRNYLKTLRVNMHEIIPKVCFGLGGKMFSSDFRTKRSNRNDADYDLDISLNYFEVSQIIADIEVLIQQIRRKRLS